MNTRHLAPLAIALLISVPALSTFADDKDGKEAERLEESRQVLLELAGVKEGAPRDLVEKAKCVIIIPGVKKAALGIGGRFGYGAAVCRTHGGSGPWGQPLMVELKGASIGFQIGGQSSDFVLLVMNQKGVNYLLSSKFTLGADASVAAGPLGRNAEAATDLQMRAEILSYSKSRGVFAGVSLEGASLKQDTDANIRLYGDRVDPKTVLLSAGKDIPAAAQGLIRALEQLASGKAPDQK